MQALHLNGDSAKRRSGAAALLCANYEKTSAKLHSENLRQRAICDAVFVDGEIEKLQKIRCSASSRDVGGEMGRAWCAMARCSAVCAVLGVRRDYLLCLTRRQPP